MASSIPGPVYRIETTRLVIRCYNPVDALLLKTSVDESREHLIPWMPWAEGEPEELQAYIDRLRYFRGSFDKGENFTMGIFNPDETRLLGGTGFHPRVGARATEIGYWIHKDFINQGLATETSAALTRVAFEILDLVRIEIHCDPANVRSAAVPRKLGFTHDATLRQRLELSDGGFRDVMIWSLLAEEYPATPCAQAQLHAFDAAGRQIC